MSKHLGNRIGFGVSSYSDGGFFNLSSQSFLLRKNKWVSKAVVSAAGTSTFSPGNGYRYNIFTSTGPLTISNGEIYVDYMIVAGGAGGASGDGAFSDTTGGGGGGGGVSEGTVLLSPGSYTVTVGGGGAATTDGTPSHITRPVGFTSITSLGGGTGGIWPQPVSGNPGGSGGGGGGGTSLFHGGNGTADQGTPGGYCAGLSFSAGGGGGAGGAGTPGTPPGPGDVGGPGGIGRVAFLGDSGIPPSYGTPGPTPGRFFGGGGGGASSSPTTPSTGGAGGGGAGGRLSLTASIRNGSSATTNTGGGGGGGAASPGGGTGGTGGSGIVILRYKEYI